MPLSLLFYLSKSVRNFPSFHTLKSLLRFSHLSDLYSGVAEVCGALSEVGGLGPLAPMSSQVIFWLGAPSGPLMSGGP